LHIRDFIAYAVRNLDVGSGYPVTKQCNKGYRVQILKSFVSWV